MGNIFGVCATSAAVADGSAEHEVKQRPTVAMLEKHTTEVEIRPEVGDGSTDCTCKEASKQERLCDGIDLFTHKDKATFQYRYEVANSRLTMLQFTVDAGGSENMMWEHAPEETKVTIEVPPLSTREVGVLRRKEPKYEAHLDISIKWAHKELDRAAVKAANAELEASMHVLADHMRAHGITAVNLGGWEAISAACQQRGIHEFIDVEFFPSDAVLFDSPEIPWEHPAVIWRRASELFGSNRDGPVTLFHDDIRPQHVKQGAFGERWSLGFLAAAAEFPDLVKKLFANPEANDLGVYEVVCYKDGLKTRVVVDDFLPCDPGTGQPCYAKCAEGLLWVSLLEKAWAKLHGGYANIWSGVPHQALMDLTGGRKEESWCDARVPLTTGDSSYVEQAMDFEVTGKGIGSISLIQKDTQHMRGAPDYSKVSFALYGPLSATGAPARELLRSPNYSSGLRELVEQVGRDEPLAKGRYMVAVFNPARSPGVGLTLVVQLEESRPEHEGSEFRGTVEHQMRELTPRMRAQMALASCISKGNISSKGPFDIAQVWLPGGSSCAFAVRSRSRAPLTLTMDFMGAEGWEVVGRTGPRIDLRCEPNGELKLVAELTHIVGVAAASLKYSISWRG